MTEPGTYTFSCHYPDKGKVQKIVLAIGPNIVWELFNVVAKPIAAILGGLVVLLISGAIAFLISIVIAVRRSESNTM
jgi:hypothetical protein